MNITKGREGRRTEGGFSLIEIAVAIAVLVGALMGLAMAMVSAWRMERSAGERKIAVQWATSQMESVRALGVGGVMSDPPAGYLFPPTWTGAANAGFNKDADADGDPEICGRFYYCEKDKPNYTSPFGQVVPLYDPLLLGLRAQSTGTPVGIVVFTDPDGATGPVEGDGYWVTVWVRWTGIQGPQELKMSSFIAP